MLVKDLHRDIFETGMLIRGMEDDGKLPIDIANREMNRFMTHCNVVNDIIKFVTEIDELREDGFGAEYILPFQMFKKNSFIDTEDNRVRLIGRDWTTPACILFIGAEGIDGHVQSDYDCYVDFLQNLEDCEKGDDGKWMFQPPPRPQYGYYGSDGKFHSGIYSYGQSPGRIRSNRGRSGIRRQSVQPITVWIDNATTTGTSSFTHGGWTTTSNIRYSVGYGNANFDVSPVHIEEPVPVEENVD